MEGVEESEYGVARRVLTVERGGRSSVSGQKRERKGGGTVRTTQIPPEKELAIAAEMMSSWRGMAR